MFDLNLVPSTDLTKVSVSFSNQPQEMTAHQLDAVIRQFAWIRSVMRPEHDPAGRDVSRSGALATSYRITASRTEGCARLQILHPGLGWLAVELDLPALETLLAEARAVAEPKPR